MPLHHGESSSSTADVSRIPKSKSNSTLLKSKEAKLQTLKKNQSKWMSERSLVTKSASSDKSQGYDNGNSNGKPLPGQFIPTIKQQQHNECDNYDTPEKNVYRRREGRSYEDLNKSYSSSNSDRRSREIGDRSNSVEGNNNALSNSHHSASYIDEGDYDIDHRLMKSNINLAQEELNGLENLAQKIAERLKHKMTEELQSNKQNQKKREVLTKYTNDYRMYSERCRILDEELRDGNIGLNKHRKDLLTSEKVLNHLRDEEESLQSDYDTIRKQLALLCKQREQQERKAALLTNEVDEGQQRCSTLSDNLDKLTMHRDKCRIFIEQYAPDDPILQEYPV